MRHLVPDKHRHEHRLLPLRTRIGRSCARCRLKTLASRPKACSRLLLNESQPLPASLRQSADAADFRLKGACRSRDESLLKRLIGNANTLNRPKPFSTGTTAFDRMRPVESVLRIARSGKQSPKVTFVARIIPSGPMDAPAILYQGSAPSPPTYVPFPSTSKEQWRE